MIPELRAADALARAWENANEDDANTAALIGIGYALLAIWQEIEQEIEEP